MAKRYDPILCMLVDEPTKAQDAEGEKWITMRGSHVKIDGEGNAVAGNAKVKNIINNGKAGSSKESSGSAREKLSKMSRSDLNHFAEMYGDYDDAESFRKEDIIEDMIEEHGEEKVGKMLNTFNEMFSKGKEKKKENPVVAKKKNESANSNASAREKLSGMSRSDLEHFAEMYGGYEDARGVRKDDIIDDMIDDYGEEKVNKMLETYNGIFKKKGKDSASALDKAIKTCDGMFQQIFGKYSSAAKQHYDRAVKELDSFKGEIKDYLTLAGKWEMQIRNDLTRIDEAYNTAGNDYYAARREIQETMDSLTQVMLRKAREKRK